MATESTVRQVLTSSADRHGMSVVTSSRSQNAPRSGLIYNPETLAAGSPVWFHPMSDGRYLAVFSRRLINAQLSDRTVKDVLLYEDYETDESPFWVMVSPATGNCEMLSEIPSERPGIRTLVAAASKQNYLFVLNSYLSSASSLQEDALLQSFRVAPTGITLVGEEMVPLALSSGLYVDRRHLWVLGKSADETGLTIARKGWARIGTDADANPIGSWQFWNRGGWTTKQDQVSPISDSRGESIPFGGTCSIARHRDTYYLTTTIPQTQEPTQKKDEENYCPAVSPDGDLVCVSDYLGNRILFIDPETGTITSQITVNRPAAIAFRPDGTFLYAINSTAGTLLAINVEKRKVVSEIVTGTLSGYFAFHPTEDVLYVAQPGSRSVAVISLLYNRVTDTISVGDKPTSLALNADGSFLYVTNVISKTVSVVNTSTKKLVKNASLGNNVPGTIAYHEPSDFLYIGSGNNMIAFSPQTNRIAAVYPALNVGNSLAVHPEESLIYLANLLDLVSAFSTEEEQITSSVTTGTDLGGVQVAISPDGSALYATNTQNKTMSVIDTTTNLVTKIISLVPALEGSTSQSLAPGLGRLVSLLSGVVSGFIPVGSGSASVLSDILGQLSSVITGQDAEIQNSLEIAQDFLQALAGLDVAGSLSQAELFENLVRSITGITEGSAVTGPIQDLLDGILSESLGLSVAEVDPLQALEQVLRTITGILTGTGSGGGGAPVLVSAHTNLVPLTPEPSWWSSTYSSRRAEDTWLKHDFSRRVASSTSTYRGGTWLQEQIPITSGYGTHETSASVTILDQLSQHTQLFTGTSPHTVILPSRAKEIGTSVTTEGAIITPDDPLDFQPRVKIFDASVRERSFGQSVISFRVELSSSTSKQVSVEYATVSNEDTSATPGEDYVALSSKVTFPPGIVSKQIDVPIIGDFDFEPDETFYLHLFDAVNATIEDATAVGTIVNDDRKTLIESLLEDLKAIINGVTSGAVEAGASTVQATLLLLEGAVRTMTGMIGDIGQNSATVLTQFFTQLTDPEATGSDRSETWVELISSILGENAGTSNEAAGLAETFLSISSEALSVLDTGLVFAFQELVSSLVSEDGGGGGSTNITGDEPSLSDQDSVNYMPYTIHNQSTSDIAVMAASRDEVMTIPKGSGMTFTPYVAEPLYSRDWSRAFASDRAPRPRQGFPYVSTSKLSVAVYRLTISGSPSSGEFRLTHNGRVSEKISLTSSQQTMSDLIRTAIALLGTVDSFIVSAVSSTEYDITIIEESSVLQVYSYRLTGGTSPSVSISVSDEASTLLTRWGIFEPFFKDATVSKAGASPAVSPPEEIPRGLADVISTLSKAVSVIGQGLSSVTPGAVTSVTQLVDQAVYLTTGQRLSGLGVNGEVVNFLQGVAGLAESPDPSPTIEVVSSFEKAIRQLTGGTGTAFGAGITVTDFVEGIIANGSGTAETLAENFRKIVVAIVGS